MIFTASASAPAPSSAFVMIIPIIMSSIVLINALLVAPVGAFSFSFSSPSIDSPSACLRSHCQQIKGRQRVSAFVLHQSMSMNDNEFTTLPKSKSKSETTNSNSKSNSNSISNSDSNSKSNYEMPWSTNQEWALQDKVPKYTIHIPQLNNNNNPTLKGGGINKTTFVLWYTMRNEVTELMGYDIDYLQMKYAALLDVDDDDANNANNSNAATANNNNNNNVPLQAPDPPGILPFINEFEFRKNGGIKGRVYGLVGIEPGTQIVTSPLKDVEQTLPKGFILTVDGSCAYELGIPKSECDDITNTNSDRGGGGYPMDLSAMKEGNNIVSNIRDQSERGRIITKDISLNDAETSQMIVNLASTTAVLFGAATAMNMLSHHLTVNVFWV